MPAGTSDHGSASGPRSDQGNPSLPVAGGPGVAVAPVPSSDAGNPSMAISDQGPAPPSGAPYAAAGTAQPPGVALPPAPPGWTWKFVGVVTGGLLEYRLVPSTQA